MSENNKLHSVHFLRFVAALGVVLHHFVSDFKSPVAVGAAGVDIFFVISGLVIGLALRPGADATSFAVKRFIRVIPLYWLATALFVFVSHLSWGNTPTQGDIWRSALLWPVFGTDWHPLYFPAWTLQCEMFFYCAATVAIIACGSYARFACLAVMAGLAMVKMPVPLSGGALHFVDTSLYLEFCAGLLISVAIERKAILPKAQGLTLVAVSLFAFAMNYGEGNLARPISWGLPAAALVYGLLSFDNARFFRNRFIRLGGDASYALYLTHLTVIAGVSWVCNINQSTLLRGWPQAIAVLLPATIAVAFLVNSYVEKPLLNVLRRALLPQRSASPRTGSLIQ